MRDPSSGKLSPAAFYAEMAEDFPVRRRHTLSPDEIVPAALDAQS